MKKILGALTAVALVMLGVLAAPVSAMANGTVSGSVTDSSAAGISGAVVEFKQGGSTNFYYADASGNYTADVPSGTFTVYFHAPGYSPEYYNDSYSVAGSTPVTITEGSTQTLNASLTDASVITGHITDYLSGPVEGQVFAISDNDQSNQWYRGLTDPATGAYTIEDLSPGTYKIWVSTNEHDDLVDEFYNNAYILANATPVVITSPGSTTTIDMQLQLGGEVSGTIENSIGSPVDVTVILSGSNGPVDNQGDGYLGAYSVSGLLADSYTATAHDYSGFFQDATSSSFAVTTATPATANFVVTPTIPDESEFYPSPAITGPSTVEAGKTYTWTVNVDGDSDAYVILYSDPVYLGAATQDQNSVATLTVTIPASTPAGAHKLTWSSYEIEGFGFESRQYFPITVTAAASGATLPATGTDVSPLVALSGLLLATGAAFVFRRRLAR